MPTDEITRERTARGEPHPRPFQRHRLVADDYHVVASAHVTPDGHQVPHEMAHVQFGNLVTSRWWDDLWLDCA